MDCEKINSRRKYLERKVERTKADEDELQTIYQLYEIQRANGPAPPRKGKHETGVKAAVLGMIHKLGADTEDIRNGQQLTLHSIHQRSWTKCTTGYATGTRLWLVLIQLHACRYTTPLTDKLLCDVLIRFDEYEEAYYGKE